MFTQGYITDSLLCMAAIWSLYVLILHRRIPLTASRVYILSSVPASLIIPFIKLPLLPADEPQSAFYTVQSAARYIAEPAQASPITADTNQFFLCLYLSGCILCTVFIAVNAIRTIRLIRNNTGEWIDGCRIVYSVSAKSAYSVFNHIFIREGYRNSPVFEPLVIHERSHIARRHTADLIIMSAYQLFCWFNPMVWHFSRMLREVHEYQADKDVLRQGVDLSLYLDLLIESETGVYPFMANTFNYGIIKKRIRMIAGGHRKMKPLRLCVVFPLLGLLFTCFSLTAKTVNSQDNKFSLEEFRDSAARKSFFRPSPLLSPPRTEGLTTDHSQRIYPFDRNRNSSEQHYFASIDTFIDSLVTEIKQNDWFIDSTALAEIQENLISAEYTSDGHVPDGIITPDGINILANPVITVRQRDPSTDPVRAKPILVVNGIVFKEYDQPFFDALGSRLKSVTVLKGSVSRDIYGSDGENGAIVVTLDNQLK